MPDREARAALNTLAGRRVSPIIIVLIAVTLAGIVAAGIALTLRVDSNSTKATQAVAKNDRQDSRISRTNADKDIIARAIAGPRGIAGLRGQTGPLGKTGRAGTLGSRGPRGATGPKGEQGPPGPAGPQGDKGDKGDTITGDRGPQGLPGATGETGPAGPQGDTGPQGEQGPPAPPTAPCETLDPALHYACTPPGP